MKKNSTVLLKGLFCLLFLITISFSSNAMQKGTVKFFNETKGFGLVIDEVTGEEVEFTSHPGANIEIGDEVMIITITNKNGEIKYIVTEGKKGLNAVNVKLA